ncbi:hypothetical protein [Ferruginibacter sp.]|uniref:hypothetical protein n=1 Tax=Ferruginibacter sp. TaxID=1940288 RepID=UPI00199A90CC|nr:hypothetical protein [Ferruginibacter sp.]MBC7626412.1 hypothetical protein [Ferruginibacter sp.]
MKFFTLPVLLLIVVAATSCNNEPQKNIEVTADTIKSVIKKIVIPESACYVSIKDKDTVNLKLEKSSQVVTGNLSYNYYGKDYNNGIINGTLSGDTLVADYKFMSEGKSSVRQVAFLISDSSLIEGFGSVEEKEGKMVFKDLKTLNFKTGTRLHKIPCPAQ